ncbi:GNAT family N-acetyltransferase [Variovorax paradoxus]|uniref:GNAT family N-acetyltransferase n=1 Tax=Variovorax paradoxus TaxID=34073 RepID=UPI001ABC4D12
MNIRIRQETPADAPAIEAVTIAAFEHAAHTSHTEQFIVRALRARGQLTVSLVAIEDEAIVGHVAVSPIRIDGQTGDWYGLGPLSVRPGCQGRGIGSQLMAQALDALRLRRAGGCVLLGDPTYYARFGFRAEPGLTLPGVPPEYFMALALAGAMPTGSVAYGEAFDATA